MEAVITSIITGLCVAVPTILKIQYDRKSNNLDDKFEALKEDIRNLDKNQCKNYLTLYLTKMENMENLGTNEPEHAHYIYDHYIKDLDGNSYIKEWWERVIK